MNLAIWDIESSNANTDFGSIIEVGGILVDENFIEKDRFNLRCRLPEGEIPQCMALIVNRTSVELLTKNTENEYIYTGCQIISKSLLNNREKKIFSITEIWNELIKKNNLFGFNCENKFYHITNLEIYNQLKNKV